MFCQNCGTQLADNVKFCPSCGTNVLDDIDVSLDAVEPKSTNELSQPAVKPKKSGFAIAGFVLGLVSLFMPIYVGIVCGVLGIVFSALGKKAVKTKGLGGKGLATAGLVLSIITLGYVLLEVLLLLTY